MPLVTSELWDDLLSCLDLRPAPGGSGYEARNQRLSHHRLFGGQLLAQSGRRG